MAKLGLTLDTNEVEPATPFEPILPGTYKVQIVQSEMRATNSGTGRYLWLEMDILDGDYAGRKLWDQLNIENSNAQAQEISRRRLSAIAVAVGKTTVSDSEELHFKPLLATVTVRPAGPDKQGVMRDAQNQIKGYKPAGGNGTTNVAQLPRQQAAPAAAKTEGKVPAWRKNRGAAS